MKKITLALSIATMAWSNLALAEEDEVTFMGPYDSAGQAVLDGADLNTGALSQGDTTAEIISPDSNSNNEEVAGAVKGEITLRETDAGIDVVSGFAKVESIAKNSDGWVGQIKSASSSMIRFQPSGRPELECPAQELANWFGPCKVPEANS